MLVDKERHKRRNLLKFFAQAAGLFIFFLDEKNETKKIKKNQCFDALDPTHPR